VRVALEQLGRPLFVDVAEFEPKPAEGIRDWRLFVQQGPEAGVEDVADAVQIAAVLPYQPLGLDCDLGVHAVVAADRDEMPACDMPARFSI